MKKDYLKNTVLTEVKSLIVIVIGLVLYAFAASAFQIPHKIVGGGATGLSTVVYYLSNQKIPVGLSFLLINVFLISIAFKILGKKFAFRTIIAVLIGSAVFGIVQPMFPVAIVNDKFLSSVIAGMIAGVGVAFALSSGGSTGGTDIVAMLVTKYKNVSPGRVLMISDSLVISSGLLINPDIEGLVYGFVLMGVTSLTVDFVLTGKKQSAQIFVFSEKYDEIAAAFSGELKRGVTVLDCHGWYSGRAQKMLIVVVRKNEVSEALRIAKRIDANAFMTMNNVMGVFGQGFEEVKGVRKK